MNNSHTSHVIVLLIAVLVAAWFYSGTNEAVWITCRGSEYFGNSDWFGYRTIRDGLWGKEVLRDYSFKYQNGTLTPFVGDIYFGGICSIHDIVKEDK